MKWRTPKVWTPPQHGEIRYRRRFCWKPTPANDGHTYWLCMVWVVEAWLRQQVYVRPGPGRPHVYREFFSWERLKVVGSHEHLMDLNDDAIAKMATELAEHRRNQKGAGLHPPKPWPRPDRPPAMRG